MYLMLRKESGYFAEEVYCRKVEMIPKQGRHWYLRKHPETRCGFKCIHEDNVLFKALTLHGLARKIRKSSQRAEIKEALDRRITTEWYDVPSSLDD